MKVADFADDDQSIVTAQSRGPAVVAALLGHGGVSDRIHFGRRSRRQALRAAEENPKKVIRFKTKPIHTDG